MNFLRFHHINPNCFIMNLKINRIVQFDKLIIALIKRNKMSKIKSNIEILMNGINSGYFTTIIRE